METIYLWDADGVLFDTFTDEGAFRWSLTIDTDLGLGEALLGRLFTEGWDEVLRGEISAKEQIAAFFEANGIDLPAQHFIDYWLEKDSNLNEAITRWLPICCSCIASNQSKVRADKFKTWFPSCIDTYFFSHEIGFLKPEDGFFEHIEKALDRPPNSLCLIDDTLNNIHAASRRGWQTHHYRTTCDLATFMERETGLHG